MLRAAQACLHAGYSPEMRCGVITLVLVISQSIFFSNSGDGFLRKLFDTTLNKNEN